MAVPGGGGCGSSRDAADGEGGAEGAREREGESAERRDAVAGGGAGADEEGAEGRSSRRRVQLWAGRDRERARDRGGGAQRAGAGARAETGRGDRGSWPVEAYATRPSGCMPCAKRLQSRNAVIVVQLCTAAARYPTQEARTERGRGPRGEVARLEEEKKKG
eukprot:1276072-Rhodomonas_salina.1